MRRLAPSIVALMLYAAAGLLPAAVRAELAAWDQTRVSEIGQQLAAACDAFWQAMRRQPGDTVGSGDAWDVSQLLHKAQTMQVQSTALAGHLRDGKGRDQTLNMYRDLKELVDDTNDVLTPHAELDEPTLAAWAKVSDLMRQIAPYYDPKATDTSQ